MGEQLSDPHKTVTIRRPLNACGKLSFRVLIAPRRSCLGLPLPEHSPVSYEYQLKKLNRLSELEKESTFNGLHKANSVRSRWASLKLEQTANVKYPEYFKFIRVEVFCLIWWIPDRCFQDSKPLGRPKLATLQNQISVTRPHTSFRHRSLHYSLPTSSHHKGLKSPILCISKPLLTSTSPKFSSTL